MKSDLESRLAAIEQRNKKVELDKAWEVSFARKFTIAALTYVAVVLYLFAINNGDPFINGLVPVMGYLLSTLALQKVKAIWSKTKQR